MKSHNCTGTAWRCYLIEHNTEYRYAFPVSSARHLTHLMPVEHQGQKVGQYCLEIDQPLTESRQGIDFFGNRYHDFAITTPHTGLKVTVHMEVSVRLPARPLQSVPWNGQSLARHSFDPEDRAGREFALTCAPYLADSPLIPAFPEAGQWALQRMGAGRQARPLHEQLLALTLAMHDEFVFDPEATAVGSPVAEVFRTRRGVCQDFAHLMIAALRGIGIPARYVSGYILTRPPAGEERLIGADATHAWVEAWCPGHGWLGLDPTNGKTVSAEFVTLARGRDYSDVIPLRGVVVGGGEHTLKVSVSMIPEGE